MTRARLAVTVALAGLAALPATAGAVLPGINGRIVFASGRDAMNGHDEEAKLFMRTIVGSVGGGAVVTPALAAFAGEQHRHPSWSPDRTRVVYSRGVFHPPTGDPNDNVNLYIQDVPSGTPRPITDPNDLISSDRPAWSPDGTKIAFEDEVTNGSGQTDIKVYEVATGHTTNITNTSSIREGKAAWSPDSRTIYYHKGDPAQMNANGQNIVSRPAGGGPESGLVVPDSGSNEFQPSISPDGTRICFTVQVPGDTSSADVVVAPLAHPAEQSVLSDDNSGSGGGADYNCTWSPDGRFVSYVRGAFGSAALVMEHSDNSDVAPIVLEDDFANFDGNPDWAPDGPPACSDSHVQAIQGKTVRVPLRCHDTGPAYERTEVREAVANDSRPAHGRLGTVKNGKPSTVPYTANAKYSGTDQFEYVGLGINGGSDRGLASMTVLEAGACANMKTGNERDNRLNGTIAGDRLLGLNGKDLIRGFAGRDCLFGGGGNDRLNGGGNADRLMGEGGRDKLIGGPGRDHLNGGKNEDTFDGGKGDDKISAADGKKEVVRCGAGKNDRAVVDHEDVQHGCEHVTRK